MKKVITILLMLVSIAFSKNWYIDNESKGTNNGDSWQNAWKSFSNINWANISPGDVIFISGGSNSKTYYESLIFNKNGNFGNPITIKVGQEANHNGIVIIDCKGSISNCVVQNSYTILDGEFNKSIHLICQNSAATGITSIRNVRNCTTRYVEVSHCGRDLRMNGIEYLGSQGGVIEYCYVHNSYQDGVKWTSASGQWGSNVLRFSRIHDNYDDGVSGEDGIDIHDCIIHFQGMTAATGHPDGIQTMGNYIRIWNNLIYDNSTQGVILSFNRTKSGHVRIYNNIFYQTSASLSARYSRGINVRSTAVATIIEDVLIANNIFVDHNFSGVEVSPNPATNISVSDPIRIYNNIFYNLYLIGGNLKYAIVCEGGAPYNPDNLLIDYNLLKDGPSGGSMIMYKGKAYTNAQFYQAGLGQSHGQINGEPEFVRYSEFGNNDYHLKENSAAIDVGIDLSNYFKEDREGNQRTGIWDLGCYNFSGQVNLIPDISYEVKDFELKQNYPNPFNPITSINWILPVATDVELSIYNLLGQKIITLVSENQSAGEHAVKWDASGLPSGIYYYMIKAGSFESVKRMFFLK